METNKTAIVSIICVSAEGDGHNIDLYANDLLITLTRPQAIEIIGQLADLIDGGFYEN